MKTISKFLMLFTLSIVLVACGGEANEASNDSESQPAVAQTEEAETTDSDADAETTESEETESSESDTADDAVAQTETEDAEFNVEITGAITSTISDNSGEVFCNESAFFMDPDNATPIIELTGGSVFSEYVRLFIPYGTTAGTYPLIGELGDSLDTTVYQPFAPVGSAFIFYGANDSSDWDYGEGTLTLTSLPTAGNEAATGSFSIELFTNDSDYEGNNQVTVTGEFDYVADPFDFADDVDVYTDTRCE